VRRARGMRVDSKLAREAREATATAISRLTPEERLNAFLDHCQLTMELREAGRQLRGTEQPT
jgi:hypothetical protein